MLLLSLCVALLLSLVGCGGSGEQATSEYSLYREAPVAVIGGEYETRNVEVGETVELDASSSRVGDPNAAEFLWTLISVPDGSEAVIDDASASLTSFLADIPGEYEVQLVVGDRQGFSEPDTAVITAVVRNNRSLNWGLRHELNVGEDPGIAVNNDGIVVEVDESPSAYDLWYRVGVIRGGIIEWGSSHRFQTGVKPTVDINDQGVVVAAYTNRSETKIYYKLGTVNVEERTISWGSERDVALGNRPAVAVNNQGKVMVVYSEFSALHLDVSCSVNDDWCEIWSRIGNVNLSNHSISWGSEQTRGHGLEPSVDVNDTGELIVVYEGYSTDKLYYRSGRISERSWNQSHSGNYGRGEAPDVAINNANRVAVVHEHENSVELYSAIGYLDNGALQLHPHSPYEVRGQVPVVALNDDNQFISMNDIGDFSLLPTSHVIEHFTTDFLPGRNYSTWMETTEPIRYKTLRDIMLPGTHNSGAYELFVGDETNAEWMHAPDWVFANCTDRIDNDTWYEEWLADACLDWTGASILLMNQTGALTAITQGTNIREQLDQGIRFFDIDVTYRDPSVYPSNSGYRTYHGLVGNSLETILADIRQYLESVDREVAIFEINGLKVGKWAENKRDYTDEEHENLMEILVAELGDYIIPREGRSYDELLSTPIGELVADGPRVILAYSGLFGKGEVGDDDYKPPIVNEWSDYFWSGFSKGTYTNTIHLKKQEMGDGGTDGAQRGQRLRFDDYLESESDKLYKLFQTLTANSDVIVMNGYSAVAGNEYRQTLRVMSQDVNHHLGQFLKESEPYFPNVVMVDFHEESDVVAHAIRIAAACNQEPITGEVFADPSQLWGPNHRMLEVEVDVSGIVSANPSSLNVWIESVRVEESDTRTGEDIYQQNNFEPDWEITGDLTLRLRAERQGQAAERIYHIKVIAEDCSGSYTFETEVRVAHDQGD